MNSMKLLSTIVVFISIVTVNGKIVTVDGQCPIDEIQPDDLARPENVIGIFNVVEQTAMDELDTTDGRVLLTPDGDTVTIRERSLPESGDECTERQILLTYTGVEGVFNVSYQAEPDSSFEEYQGFILQLQPYSTNEGDIGVYTVILFLCRDISDSQYEADVLVYSLLTELTASLREDVELRLSFSGLSNLFPLLVSETQNEECRFSDEEENADYYIL